MYERYGEGKTTNSMITQEGWSICSGWVYELRGYDVTPTSTQRTETVL
jgi:hypothetical protein